MNKQLTSADTWDQYKIPDKLRDQLMREGFKNPSNAQVAFYKQIQDDKSRSGLLEAPTGTGKTIAFVTHALMTADVSVRKPQVVIFVHTQILGFQVIAEIKKLQDAMGLKSSLLLGQNANIVFDETAQIVVTTPPSYIDNFLPKTVRGNQRPPRYASNLKLLILDEADFYWRDTNMKENMSTIFGAATKAQILLFSATLDKEISDRIKKEYLSHCRDPFHEYFKITLENTEHFFMDMRGAGGESGKRLILQKLFDLNIYDTGFKAIIFCRTRNQVDEIYNLIIKAGYEASRYHGDMLQEERQHEYARFLNGDTRVLISTDMLARGIDIVTIALVVNYEVPTEGRDYVVSPSNYVHRIGRSGRYGRKSIALTFVNGDKDMSDVREIQQYVDKRFEKTNIITELKESEMKEKIELALKDEKADEVETDLVLGIMGEANSNKRVKNYKGKDENDRKDRSDRKHDQKGAEKLSEHQEHQKHQEHQEPAKDAQALDIDFA